MGHRALGALGINRWPTISGHRQIYRKLGQLGSTLKRDGETPTHFEKQENAAWTVRLEARVHSRAPAMGAERLLAHAGCPA